MDDWFHSFYTYRDQKTGIDVSRRTYTRTVCLVSLTEHKHDHQRTPYSNSRLSLHRARNGVIRPGIRKSTPLLSSIFLHIIFLTRSVGHLRCLAYESFRTSWTSPHCHHGGSHHKLNPVSVDGITVFPLIRLHLGRNIIGVLQQYARKQAYMVCHSTSLPLDVLLIN